MAHAAMTLEARCRRTFRQSVSHHVMRAKMNKFNGSAPRQNSRMNYLRISMCHEYLRLTGLTDIDMHKIVPIYNSRFRLRDTEIAEDGVDVDNFLSSETHRLAFCF